MASLPDTILQKIIHDDGYCRKVLPFIKSCYFEDSHRKVYELLLKFVEKYNKLPTRESLEIDLDASEISEQDYGPVSELIHRLDENPTVDDKWLIESTEKWCKDRAVYLAVMDSIEIINGNKEKPQSAIPEILQKALAINFDATVGHEYVADWEKRFDFYHRLEERLPFDLDYFNKITKNGVPRKTLNVVLGGVGCGKTLVMCHLASSYLTQGKNVLYITLEMAEERIAERIDANLMNVSLDQVAELNRPDFSDRISKIQSKTTGRLVIKEYPTACAHSGNFRALLQELRLKKDFIPDVIFVDYINICASSRIKGLSGSINTYSFVKAIAEELRGLAVEFNVPLWTATQLTRSGFDDSDPGMTDTAESFGLPASCDLMFVIVTSDELEKLGQVMVKQLKNRYTDVAQNKRFVLGMDKSRMKLYDVDGRAQTLIQTAISTGPNQSKKPEGDYTGFKFD